MAEELKPCPFCGGKVKLEVVSGDDYMFYTINRAAYNEKGSCKCRVYMDSAMFGTKSSQTNKDMYRKRLIDAWNTRIKEG